MCPLVTGKMLPPLAAVLWPLEGKAAFYWLFFSTPGEDPWSWLCARESVTLPGTLCLELVNIVLIRQLLSENGSLSNSKLFAGGELFQ